MRRISKFPTSYSTQLARAAMDAIKRNGGTLFYVPEVLANSGTFTDSAGTTPATTVGDVLGLMLDKAGTVGPSVALPAMAAHNATATGTTFPATVTKTSGTIFGFLAAAFNTVGDVYEYTISWSGNTLGRSLSIDAATGAVFSSAVSGTATFRYRQTITDFYIFALGASNGETLTIDSLTVKQITGNHASQPTTNFKPLLQVNAQGKYAISFDGTDDFLQTGITTGNQGWVCAGVRFGAPLANYETVFSNGAGSAALKGVWLVRQTGGSDSSALLMAVGNGTALAQVQAPSGLNILGAARVVEGGWTASTVEVGVDGQTASAARTGDATPAPYTTLVGAYVSGFHHLGGPMTAQVICPVLPSAADRIIIRKWIGSLQGQSL